jgi:hypothetical protein
VAGVVAYALLRWRARELRERDRRGLALAVALAIFALRLLGNVPALNDDFLPAISVGDLLGFPTAALAALAYWLSWPGGEARPTAGWAVRWALGLGLVGFVVNVAVI